MKKIILISDGWRRLVTYAWVAGIMREIRKRDLDIALYQYNSYGNWSKDALHNIGEYNIYNLPDFSEYDGVILDCSNISDQKQKRKIINKLHETGLPVVSIEFEEEKFHCISIDNYGPIIELMHHMYEKHDCRRFVFAGGPKNAFGNRRRARAYKQCIEEFGLKLDENPILYGEYDYNTGVRYMREFVEQKRKLPDVFVCVNDNIAAGICTEAEKNGYQVPRDFKVTGFDNLDKAAFFRPQITTVCLNREEIGSACVDILMRIWNGEEVPAKSYVKSECVYGESCGCPNSGRVDYREHIRTQIISETAKNADDTLLVELEAQMARQSDITGMFDCIMDYFQKLRCDGMYIVVDRNLFIGDAGTIFPTEGYNWENLIVAAGFEDHERIPIKDVNELNHHLEEKASQSAYMFTPIHFREQSVGYIILKNGHFLYDNPYYYDIHCTIVRMLENRFKQLQLERALGKLQELYNHDPLTRAYNRIAYNEWIRPAFLDYSRQGIICALVFLDADNFKRLNDTFGHEYGDKVLQRIVAVLKEQCPEGGYVCRYGGDEFITFFPHATPANTNEYVQKVQKLLGKERIEVSMGTKLTQPGDGESLDDYLALADERMYQQKQQRKEQSHDAQ